MKIYKIKNTFYLLAFTVLVIITGFSILLLPVSIIGMIWQIFSISREIWIDIFMASLVVNVIAVIAFMCIRSRY